MNYWKKIPERGRDWICVLAIAAAGAAIAVAMTGCAVPSTFEGTVKPDGTVTIHTVEVDTVLPGTGVAITSSTLTPPPEPGLGLLGILGWGLGAVGALQFAGPKSWANWLTVLKPSASWAGTGQSLAANLGIWHTPAEAKPAPPTGV